MLSFWRSLHISLTMDSEHMGGKVDHEVLELGEEENLPTSSSLHGKK
jgi:hypothetical protein